MFGTPWLREVRGDGTLVSQDPLMIGRWMKWKAS